MAVIHVVVDAAHHDLFDWLAAIGGVVGGFAAVVALVFAAISKRDAARSAEAAEKTQALADEQVRIMREEAETAKAERERRAAPEMQLEAQAIGISDDLPPALIVLTAGFSNEHGTRPIGRLDVVPDHVVPPVR